MTFDDAMPAQRRNRDFNQRHRDVGAAKWEQGAQATRTVLAAAVLDVRV